MGKQHFPLWRVCPEEERIGRDRGALQFIHFQNNMISCIGVCEYQRQNFD